MVQHTIRYGRNSLALDGCRAWRMLRRVCHYPREGVQRPPICTAATLSPRGARLAVFVNYTHMSGFSMLHVPTWCVQSSKITRRVANPSTNRLGELRYINIVVRARLQHHAIRVDLFHTDYVNLPGLVGGSSSRRRPRKTVARGKAEVQSWELTARELYGHSPRRGDAQWSTSRELSLYKWHTSADEAAICRAGCRRSRSADPVEVGITLLCGFWNGTLPASGRGSLQDIILSPASYNSEPNAGEVTRQAQASRIGDVDHGTSALKQQERIANRVTPRRALRGETGTCVSHKTRS